MEKLLCLLYMTLFGSYLTLIFTSLKVFFRIKESEGAHFTMSGFLKTLYYEIPVYSTG